MSPTYVLNEDTQLVIRAIGVSRTACKDEFRRNLRSHSWSEFSFFIICPPHTATHCTDTELRITVHTHTKSLAVLLYPGILVLACLDSVCLDSVWKSNIVGTDFYLSRVTPYVRTYGTLHLLTFVLQGILANSSVGMPKTHNISPYRCAPHDHGDIMLFHGMSSGYHIRGIRWYV